jgi:hypothetical protein
MTAAKDQDGFWVISVNRKTGKTTTSRLITDRDAAWSESIKRARPTVYTTVVGRRQS